MNEIRKVHRADRHLTVSTTELVPGLPINVLITTEDRAGRISERLGLSMSRESAEEVRDAITEALELTKPAPTKAERILHAATVPYSANLQEACLALAEVRAIIAEDGPL